MLSGPHQSLESKNFSRIQKAAFQFAHHTLPVLASITATANRGIISTSVTAPLSENKRDFIYLIWMWYFF